MNTHALFEEPVVEIVSGKIRGATSAIGCHFKGIPYAGTTEGAQRFLPPSPTPSWTGVCDAIDFALRSALPARRRHHQAGKRLDSRFADHR